MWWAISKKEGFLPDSELYLKRFAASAVIAVELVLPSVTSNNTWLGSGVV
jgi:hypothetical protein